MIGKMRHRITVEANDTSDDGLGGDSDASWSTVVTTWASMEHVSLAGTIGPGGQLMDQTRINFTVRDNGAGSVRQGQRVSYDSRYFYIEAVSNADERGRFKTLATVERAEG